MATSPATLAYGWRDFQFNADQSNPVLKILNLPALIFVFVFTICALPVAAQTKAIAITIDDLPYATLGPTHSDVAEARANIDKILETLKAHHVPVVAFVNEQKLQVDGQMDARVALLEQWLNAGVELGNHTYSHLDLNKNPETVCEDDLIKGEVVTQRLMKEHGKAERYFRHPFLRTGATIEQKHQFDAFLKSRGYIVAPVTIENLDWAFNGAYRQALKDGDRNAVAKIPNAYLAQTEADIGYYEKVADTLFGRPIAYVMLMHSDELNAMMLDKVLAKFEAHGYKFITLEEALKDPAYQTNDDYAEPTGAWENRWAKTLGKTQELKGSPEAPKWMWDLYNKASGQ
jgi:peptidoglycan/xylan/chitin deacetylase (PgdA/CDA1 family)